MFDQLNIVVSVIIPAYNAERTIREALDSVAAQTFRDYELIVVDDCSTDSTRETVETWRSDHEDDVKVTILSLDSNSGPASARNAGIAKAQGEWIAFLDADDVWLPDRLERGMSIAELHRDSALICGGLILLEGEKQSVAGTINDLTTLHVVSFASGNQVATSTALVRKQVIESVGGFDEQFRGPEDYDLWMRIVRGHKIVRTSAPMVRYRESSMGLCLNDREFLPQVILVLDKAFGPGGELENRPGLKRLAISTQYWNAAWMAFRTGARWRAVAHLLKAFMLNAVAEGSVKRPWIATMGRYLCGSRTTDHGQRTTDKRLQNIDESVD